MIIEKAILQKFLSGIVPVRPDGVITVKSGIATVSHSDASNASVVYTSTKFDCEDKVLGVNFEELLRTVNVADKGSISMEFSNVIKFKSGTYRRNISLIVPTYLPEVRPRLNIPFTNVIDIDIEEFTKNISQIEASTGVQKNDLLKVAFKLEGDCFGIKTESDPVDFVECDFEIISQEKRGGDAISHYSFDYISLFASALKKLNTKNVQVSFGDGMPISFYSKDADIELLYILAQRADGSD